MYDDINSYTNRLLDEISYTSGYDVAKLNEIRSSLTKLALYNYKSSDIPHFDTVGVHDAYTELILVQLYALAASTPERSKYPLIDELVRDLTETNNNSDATKRANYSTAVVDYNAFVAENKNELEKAGKTTKQLPSFFLTQ